MKEAFRDRVIYILAVPRATSQDGGTYECSITRIMSGAVRASGVAVTIFGETLFCFVSYFQSAGQTSSSTMPQRCHTSTRCFECVEILSGC